jgi:SAM-dependent methyltransferase
MESILPTSLIPRRIRRIPYYLQQPYRVLDRFVPKGPELLEHRAIGCARLKGRGAEVGALNNPSWVPAGCQVSYFDCASVEEALAAFPELSAADLVAVDHIGNLDRGDLAQAFPHQDLDFIIANHVIEHVANPLRLLEQLFTVVRVGGYVVLSAPDKEFTFDKPRELTPFEHVFEEYQRGVETVDRAHYEAFVRAVLPDRLEPGDKNLDALIAHVASRREHAHVWTATTFREFVVRGLEILGITVRPVFESISQRNAIEYFGIWEKTSGPPPRWQRSYKLSLLKSLWTEFRASN